MTKRKGGNKEQLLEQSDFEQSKAETVSRLYSATIGFIQASRLVSENKLVIEKLTNEQLNGARMEQNILLLIQSDGVFTVPSMLFLVLEEMGENEIDIRNAITLLIQRGEILLTDRNRLQIPQL